MFQLFRKRSVWLPTWRALLIALIGLGLAAWLFFANIHGFLSVTKPAEGASILIVEGWIPDSILEGLLADFKPGEPYDYICTTGPPLPKGHYLIELNSFAALTGKTLEKLGVPTARIIVAPAEAKDKDRTYQSAVALKRRLEASDVAELREARAIDVLTSDVHGRRTRMVFKKALGDGIEVGIISAAPSSYDARRWYASSEGVKAVITEVISLGYEWFGKKDR